MANIVANIFGSSPVQPLEKHMDIVYRCAKKLNPFFTAAAKGDWDTASNVRDEVDQLEHEADDVKKEIDSEAFFNHRSQTSSCTDQASRANTKRLKTWRF